MEEGSSKKELIEKIAKLEDENEQLGYQLMLKNNIIADLENQRLTVTQEAIRKLKEQNLFLELKNKELEEFVYITSHDLQEPLNTIISYIFLFEEDYGEELNQETELYLNFISKAANRMSLLMKGLLDYTRLELDQDIEEIDTNQLIEDVLESLDASIKNNKAEIIVDDDLPKIKGNRTQISLLFQNLISNSIKYNRPEVLPKIHIYSDDNEQEWKFVVKDNGRGISKEHLEKVFKIFQRLNLADEKNLGIGLAHCKKIVALHGGKIWVESVPGEGSKFNFTPKKEPSERKVREHFTY